MFISEICNKQIFSGRSWFGSVESSLMLFGLFPVTGESYGEGKVSDAAESRELYCYMRGQIK